MKLVRWMMPLIHRTGGEVCIGWKTKDGRFTVERKDGGHAFGLWWMLKDTKRPENTKHKGLSGAMFDGIECDTLAEAREAIGEFLAEEAEDVQRIAECK